VLCNEQADNDLPQNWTASLDYAGLYFDGTNNDSIFARPGFPCLLVGIEEIKNATSSFNVYPNPASDLLNVQFEAKFNSIATIKVYDVTGRIVFEQKQVALNGINKHLINTSGFMKGMYMLEVETGESNLKTRFIKN
jgi:hypothetical protein